MEGADLLIYPHSLKLEEVLADVKSSQDGLSADEADLRLKQHGRNTLQEKRVSKFILFLRQFNSLLVYICLLYTSPSPRDGLLSRMPSSA